MRSNGRRFCYVFLPFSVLVYAHKLPFLLLPRFVCLCEVRFLDFEFRFGMSGRCHWLPLVRVPCSIVIIWRRICAHVRLRRQAGHSIFVLILAISIQIERCVRRIRSRPKFVGGCIRFTDFGERLLCAECATAKSYAREENVASEESQMIWLMLNADG